MKKILTILTILLLLTGCTNSNEEVVENNEPTIIETQNPTLFTYKENITIDMTKDYDINEIVSPNEGVVIIDELDTENKILKVSAVKGDVMEKVNIPVELYNPYPITCHRDPNVDPMYSIISEKSRASTLSFLDKDTVRLYYGETDEEFILPFDNEKLTFSFSPTLSPETIEKTGNDTFKLTYAGKKDDGSLSQIWYVCDCKLPF